MNPVLSKLTMCVCAAGTGAAVVPVAQSVRHHYAPKRHAVHRVARPPVAAAPALASATPDCPPGVGVAGPGLGDGSTGGLTALTGPVQASPGSSGGAGGFTPVFLGSEDSDLEGGGGGFGGNGGGIGGGGGGQPGPGNGGGTPGNGNPPVSSNAPEPTTWVLMISGFGLVGAALRYKVVARA